MDVCFYVFGCKFLVDVVICICEYFFIKWVGFYLVVNVECYFKFLYEFYWIFQGYEDVVVCSFVLVEEINFLFDELVY